MRKFLVLVWLLAPVGLIYFHYGPGQKLMAFDRAATLVKRAESLEQLANKESSPENWQRVVDAYQQAGKILGEDDSLSAKRIRLNTANALMYQGQLYEAMQELDILLDDAVRNKMPEAYAGQVRETLARCQFGAAWVMRLEGAETKSWTAQAEKARQNFRLLAEASLDNVADTGAPAVQQPLAREKLDAPEAIDHQKNLEATVRMEQLDASIIKGLPLPKEAQNGQGKGLSDKLGKKEGEGEGEGNEGIGEKQERDARGKGAGSGQRGSGLGS